jgi:hypothetical protein
MRERQHKLGIQLQKLLLSTQHFGELK